MAVNRVVISLWGRNVRDRVGPPNKDKAWSLFSEQGHQRPWKDKKVEAPKAGTESCLLWS